MLIVMEIIILNNNVLFETGKTTMSLNNETNSTDPMTVSIVHSAFMNIVGPDGRGDPKNGNVLHSV